MHPNSAPLMKEQKRRQRMHACSACGARRVAAMHAVVHELWTCPGPFHTGSALDVGVAGRHAQLVDEADAHHDAAREE